MTCSVKSSAYANSRTDECLISFLEYEIYSQYQAEKCSQVVPFQLHLECNHGEKRYFAGLSGAKKGNG